MTATDSMMLDWCARNLTRVATLDSDKPGTSKVEIEFAIDEHEFVLAAAEGKTMEAAFRQAVLMGMERTGEF